MAIGIDIGDKYVKFGPGAAFKMTILSMNGTTYHILRGKYMDLFSKETGQMNKLGLPDRVMVDNPTTGKPYFGRFGPDFLSKGKNGKVTRMELKMQCNSKHINEKGYPTREGEKDGSCEICALFGQAVIQAREDFGAEKAKKLKRLEKALVALKTEGDTEGVIATEKDIKNLANDYFNFRDFKEMDTSVEYKMEFCFTDDSEKKYYQTFPKTHWVRAVAMALGASEDDCKAKMYTIVNSGALNETKIEVTTKNRSTQFGDTQDWIIGKYAKASKSELPVKPEYKPKEGSMGAFRAERNEYKDKYPHAVRWIIRHMVNGVQDHGEVEGPMVYQGQSAAELVNKLISKSKAGMDGNASLRLNWGAIKNESDVVNAIMDSCVKPIDAKAAVELEDAALGKPTHMIVVPDWL